MPSSGLMRNSPKIVYVTPTHADRVTERRWTLHVTQVEGARSENGRAIIKLRSIQRSDKGTPVLVRIKSASRTIDRLASLGGSLAKYEPFLKC